MKELEMILAAITNLGAAGKEAFIWWLVFDKLIAGLLWVIPALAIAYAAIRITAINCLGAQLRDAMGVGAPGGLTRDEEREMFAWIRAKRDDR